MDLAVDGKPRARFRLDEGHRLRDREVARGRRRSRIVNGRSPESVAAARKEITAAVPNAPLDGFRRDLATAEAADARFRAQSARRHPGHNLGIFEPKAFEEIPRRGLATLSST